MVVRLIDRHGDHFVGTHGDEMPKELAKGRDVRAAMVLAGEWLDIWAGAGLWRQQWKRRKPSHLRSAHQARRERLAAFRQRKAMRESAKDG